MESVKLADGPEGFTLKKDKERKAKAPLKAYCSSWTCTKPIRDLHKEKADTTRKMIKEVKLGTSTCPDCGYVLIWTNRPLKT